jgi:hypothetical protein
VQLFHVVVHARTFIQILMAVLVFGLGVPQPVCAAVMPDACKCCCCLDGQMGKCQSEKACKQSCARVQTQTVDQQAPVRPLRAPDAASLALLFSIAPTEINYFALNPSVRRWDSNAAPPFSGCPPQAMLCLWRV